MRTLRSKKFFFIITEKFNKIPMGTRMLNSSDFLKSITKREKNGIKSSLTIVVLLSSSGTATTQQCF